MANVVEELVVRLTADVASLRAQMDEIASQVHSDNEEIISSSEGVATSLRTAMGAVVAFWGAFEAKEALKSLVEANIQMQQIQYTLEYATGSANAAATQMEFLAQVSNALGIDLKEAGMQYARLISAAQGQSLSIQTLQSLYIGLAKTFDILHASTYAQQRVMNTFTEMMSMGTIHAQQLRMMLSRDLPGVNFIGIAAQQLGVTTEALNEMMEKGQLTADVLMPALAKGLNDAADHGTALNDAIHGTNATLNRFHTAVFEVEDEIAQKFTPAGAAMVDQLTQILHALAPLDPKIQENKDSFGGLREAVNDSAEAFLFLKAVVVTAFDILKGVIDTLVSDAVNGFYFWYSAIKLVVDEVEYLWDVFKGFANGSVSVLGGVGEALNDLIHGKFSEAQAAVSSLGQKFTGAFNLAPASIAVTEDLANMGDSVKLFVTQTVQTWKDAGTSIVDEWKTTMDQIHKITQVAPKPGDSTLPNVTPQAPGTPGGASGAYPGSLESMGLSEPSLGGGANGGIPLLNLKGDSERALQQQYLRYTKSREAEAALVASAQQEAARKTRAAWMEALNPISNAFNQSITGMIRGTTTLHNAVANMLQSILASYIQTGVKIAEKWIANEAAQTAATQAGNAARLATQSTTQAASHAMSAATGSQTVMQDAAKAFSGTYASVAQIPYVGWLLAPAAAAAAFAAVAAYEGLASLAVGTTYVPQTGLYTLHQGEAVMPKTWVQGMREFMAGGGRGGAAAAGGGGVNLTLQGAHIGNYFLADKRMLAAAIQTIAREGYLRGA